MDESILNTIKDLLGISEDDSSFDTDVLIHINTYLHRLYELGYGTEPFEIAGEEEIWTDLLKSTKDFSMVKTFLYLSVKIIFDPPASSIVMECYKDEIKKLEWRIYKASDENDNDRM